MVVNSDYSAFGDILQSVDRVVHNRNVYLFK